MEQQYGENCLRRRKLFERTVTLKNCQIFLCCKQRSGRPSIPTPDNNIEAVDQMIRADRYTKTDEIPNEFHTSHGSTFSIIHESLNFRKSVLVEFNVN